MTSQPAFASGEPLPTEAPSEDHWVLPLSVDEPTRMQPGGVQWTAWGPFRCFFCGLLSNREDIAQPNDIDQSGYTDADLILRAYERGGEAALSRLRGSFVVAILDLKRGMAIVARDPLGSHPLFYVEAGSRVLFAVLPQPLLDCPGVSRAINRAVVADFLCARWPDRHETFFAAVRRVPRGWRAMISGGRLRLERSWNPISADRPVQWLTVEETGRFDEAFDRAVDRCLHDGPTGIFLSGGLDSISVAAVASDRARRNGQSPPLALSLGFPHPTCDEREIQTAVAKELGLHQHLVDFHEALGSRPFLEQTLELNKLTSAPLLNVWQPPYVALARRASLDGVRTILTGQGGDEWLCVSHYIAADLIRRGAFVDLAQFVGTVYRSYQLDLLPVTRATLFTYGLRPLAALALHRLMPKARKASRLKRLLAGDPIWVAPDPALRAEQRHRAEERLTDPDPPYGFYVRDTLFWLDHSIVSWQAEEQFELGRRIGIRFLHPYYDPDLVEMLCRTPPNILNSGGRSKGPVRDTLARRFPALGLTGQRKTLATTFYQGFLLREGPAIADAIGDFPSLSELGIVDGKLARASVCAGLKRPGRAIARSWVPINVEMWVRFHSTKMR
jgi:asparagine synthase (glutamine-hydrolysing)